MNRKLNEMSDDEWHAWYLLTPQERWRQSMKLWEWYVKNGGSLDPEPDCQSPFYFDELADPADPAVLPDLIVEQR